MSALTPRVRDFGGRIGGFAGLSIVGALAPFLVLPVVARLASASEWAAIALGQSVGGLLAIVVSLGWNLMGPSLVAARKPQDRPVLFAASLLSRLVALAVLLPLATVIVLLLVPPAHGPLAMAISATAMVAGVGVEWYCVGTGSWRSIAGYELLPRLLACALAVPVLWVTGELLLYPALLLVASAMGIGMFSAHELRGADLWTTFTMKSVVTMVKRSHRSLVTEVAGGTYSAGSTALVSSTAGVADVAFFSSGDRVFRLALQSVVALSRASQGWVVTELGCLRSRVRYALVAHALLGLVGAIGLGLCGPWMSNIVFGDQLAFNAATGWALGCAFMAISWSAGLGRLLLIPNGYIRAVMVSTLAGAFFGVPGIIVGAYLWGAAGGAAGVALSQLIVCLCQIPASRSVWRNDVLRGPV